MYTIDYYTATDKQPAT